MTLLKCYESRERRTATGELYKKVQKPIDYAISLWYNQNVRETKNEKGDPMKIKQITIFVKGKGLKVLSRKELVEYFDNDVMAGDEIEIVEVQY